MKTYTLIILLMMTSLLILGIGCQGRPSEDPPIHLNPNMDSQPRYDPQETGTFFEDKSAMRQPVEGTVARGSLEEDSVYSKGIDPKTGKPVTTSPVAITMSGLERGKERFTIYCAVCHSQVGDGKGIMLKRGYVPPPNFHTDLIREYPDGHIFDVITNGIRNMPSYRQQIPVEDRWLIVNYLRALQRSQNAKASDVPEQVRETLR